MLLVSKMRNSTGSMLIHIIASLLLSWLSMLPFIENRHIRLVLILPASLMLLRIFQYWHQAKKLQFAREQYKWLLDHLLARISAGTSLEHSLIEAADSLTTLLGRNSALTIQLRKARNQINAGQKLDQVLIELGRTISCPETRIFFPALKALLLSGGQIEQFIRQQLHQVIEQITMQQDVESENSQRRTEALILSFLPFALSLLLRSSMDAMHEMGSHLLVQLAYAIAYLLSISALYLALSGLFSIAEDGSWKPATYSFSKFAAHFANAGSKTKKIYQKYMPGGVRTRLFQQLQADARFKNMAAEKIVEQFFCRKIILMLYSLPPSLVLSLSYPVLPFWILLPVLISLLQDRQLFSRAARQAVAYRLEIPWFLNTISSLLQSGLSLHKSIEISSSVLLGLEKKSGYNFKIIDNDLHKVRKYLSMSWPGSKIVEALAADCPVPEAQATLLLMCRFEKSGGAELLQMIGLQCSMCWNVQRSALRRAMEQKSMRLLIPMTMDLVAILLVAMLPAIISLHLI